MHEDDSKYGAVRGRERSPSPIEPKIKVKKSVEVKDGVKSAGVGGPSLK